MKIPVSYISLYLIFTGLLVSCSVSKHRSTSENVRNNGLVLSARVVTSADTLTLRFPHKHPASLAIEDPGHVWYVIHEAGVNTSLMTDKKYRYSTSITFQIATLTGVTWVDGKQVRRKVFSRPGKYTIYMADNLETEPENTFFLMKTLIYK